MGKIKETIDTLKNTLKDLVTADNTDAVAKVQKVIDELETQGNNLETENLSLKDKIVDMVKGNLSSDTPPSDDNQPAQKKSVDEAMKDALAEVLKDNKK